MFCYNAGNISFVCFCLQVLCLACLLVVLCFTSTWFCAWVIVLFKFVLVLGILFIMFLFLVLVCCFVYFGLVWCCICFVHLFVVFDRLVLWVVQWVGLWLML